MRRALIAPLDWSLKRPVRSAEQAPTPTAEFSFGAVLRTYFTTSPAGSVATGPGSCGGPCPVGRALLGVGVLHAAAVREALQLGDVLHQDAADFENALRVAVDRHVIGGDDDLRRGACRVARSPATRRRRLRRRATSRPCSSTLRAAPGRRCCGTSPTGRSGASSSTGRIGDFGESESMLLVMSSGAVLRK